MRAWLLVTFFALSGTLSAQTYHVRAGATGQNNGSNWDNAYTTLPNKLVRGATYYVAAGNYSSYTFSDALSGTSFITVKKATITEHGSSTGWQDSYAAGQAVWPTWEFTSGYYVIDGVTRNSDWRSGHGFKLRNPNPSPTVRITQNSVSQITFAHIEIQGLGRYLGEFSSQPSPSLDEGFYFFGNSHLTFRNGYFHDIEGAAFKTGGNSYITIESCVIARNRTDPWFHGTAWGGQNDDNVIMRYNIWEDITGTAVISVLNRNSNADVNENWEIYGNVFCATANFTSGCGDGTIAVINNQIARNWKIYNNTFIKLRGSSSRISVGVNGSSGNSNVKIYNNFWWDSRTAGYVLNNCTDCASTHNRYDGTPSNTEPNSQINASASTAAFVNYSAKNYRLAAATAAGVALPSPYHQDMDGKTRGADGNWDRGAYEFGSGAADTTPPVVSGVAAGSIGATNATITWNTDEAATTVVQYGLTTSYGSTATDANYVNAHSRTIGGLTPNTTYNYRVQSVDVAGNSTTSGNFTFQTTVLDTTAPVVTVTAPTGAGIFSNTVNFAATATDNIGVAGVQFLVGGVAVGAEITSAPYVLAWDSWSVGNGTHGVQARARDTSGNTTTSAAVNLQVLNQSGGVPSGQVGYWSLNEGSGSTAAGNPGGVAALQTGASWTTGRYGNAVSLNGTSSGFVSIADAASLRAANPTISLWVRHSTLPTSGVFMQYLEKGLDDHDNYAIGVALMPAGLQLFFEFEDTSGTHRRFYQSGTVALTTGTWAHITVSFNDAANEARFYKDGVLVGTVTISQSLNTALTHPIYIGRENFASSPWPLNGAVDEVRIFNRTLAANEVLAVFQSSAPPAPLPPTNLHVAVQ